MRTGLFCDFLCPNYAIRIACCECIPPSIGTPFRLMQTDPDTQKEMCIKPISLRISEKVIIDEDCTSEESVWQWGKGKIIWIISGIDYAGVDYDSFHYLP